LAFELTVKKNNLISPVNWKEGLACIDWFYAFMKQNPNLSIRTPEGCSFCQATSFNHHNISSFFTKLEQILQRWPVFVDGTRIFNLDETNTSTVPEKLPTISTDTLGNQASSSGYQ
jgi:hypothetical protein